MDDRSGPLKDLSNQARTAAGVLRAIGNERRLLILCSLAARGEANVAELAAASGSSQSATSQHLARMREEGLVAFRKTRQTIWYRIADPRIENLLGNLQRLYCEPGPDAHAADGRR